MEKQKGTGWYVFLIVGLLLGAVLGYYASEKGLIKQKVVGKSLASDYYGSCIDKAKGAGFSGDSTASGALDCLEAYNEECGRQAEGLT